MSSVFPLNIDPKQDSPKRLSLLSGVPEKYFTPALEFNKIIEALEELSKAKESTSKIIFLDRSGSGYNHSAANNQPLTGALTVDLTGSVGGGGAIALWNGAVNPVVTLINQTTETLNVNDTIITQGVYKILFIKLFGKIEMYIPDAESGGTTPPAGSAPSSPILALTEQIIPVGGTVPSAPSLTLTEQTI